MTPLVPDEKPVVDAAIALLERTGRPTEKADKPAAPDSSKPLSVYPYTTVYGGGTSDVTGGLNHPHADGTSEIQVTSVARDVDGALWMQARAREQLLDVAAFREQLRDRVDRTVVWISHEVARPALRDPEAKPPLFFAVDIFHIRTTPA